MVCCAAVVLALTADHHGSTEVKVGMVQEDEHGPDGAYLHPSTGGEAIMLSSSLGEEDDADADLAELSTHASMGMARCQKLYSIVPPVYNVTCVM